MTTTNPQQLQRDLALRAAANRAALADRQAAARALQTAKAKASAQSR